jgi:hypothetical protein
VAQGRSLYSTVDTDRQFRSARSQKLIRESSKTGRGRQAEPDLSR